MNIERGDTVKVTDGVYQGTKGTVVYDEGSHYLLDCGDNVSITVEKQYTRKI
jgi:ribosomal protein L24